MMEFVKKGPEDAEELSGYLYPLWHGVYDPMITWEEAEYIFRIWTEPDIIRESMSAGYEYGYIFHEGERIGLYSFHVQDDGRFYINKIYLEEMFRGKGLGNKALQKMIDLARSSGCSKAYLNVYYDNEKAFKAYIRAGFTDYYRDKEDIGNGYYRDDYIMSMDLQ